MKCAPCLITLKQNRWRGKRYRFPLNTPDTKTARFLYPFHRNRCAAVPNGRKAPEANTPGSFHLPRHPHRHMIQPLKRLPQKRNPSFRVFSSFGGAQTRKSREGSVFAVKIPSNAPGFFTAGEIGIFKDGGASRKMPHPPAFFMAVNLVIAILRRRAGILNSKREAGSK